MPQGDVLKFEECALLHQEAMAQFSTRKTLLDKMENMFFLKDASLPEKDYIRKVVSPDPRNYIQGAVRLMTSSRTQWNVPRTSNSDSLKNESSAIERVCEAIAIASGNITNKPVEVEAALSAFLYGEVHIKVVNTKAMLEGLSGSKQQRAKVTNMRTPLLLQCVNPKVGFPIYDSNGLSVYSSEEKVMVDYLRSKYGQDVAKDKKVTDKVDFVDFWNDSTHCCWIKGDVKPLLLDENKLGFIPVFCEIVEGSDFFVEENQPTRQPLMYTMSESGLWAAQNMAYTIMSSLALSIAATPMMEFTQGKEGDQIQIDNEDIPWGQVTVPPGASYKSLIKQVIDPSIIKIAELAEQKGMESAIYRQTLGEPLGNNATFSMLSLATNSGRLPLVPYERCISSVMGKAMYGGLQMLRAGGVGETTVQSTIGPVTYDFKKLPEAFILEAKLEVAVPQDERENVAIAIQATQGDRPLVTHEFARRKWLNIHQSDTMDEDIWTEQRLSLMAQLDLKQMVEQAQANAQAAAQGVPPESTDASMTPQSQNGVPGIAAKSPQQPIGTFGKNETEVV